MNQSFWENIKWPYQNTLCKIYVQQTSNDINFSKFCQICIPWSWNKSYNTWNIPVGIECTSNYNTTWKATLYYYPFHHSLASTNTSHKPYPMSVISMVPQKFLVTIKNTQHYPLTKTTLSHHQSMYKTNHWHSIK